MKQLLLICAVVALVGGCASTPKVVPANIANPIVEKAIRRQISKPTGELTKADLEKVTKLDLEKNKLTEIPKGLEKLTKLTWLSLENNQLTSVTGLENLTQLVSLELSENQLTSVKGLEKLTQLRGLYLGSNQLTDVLQNVHGDGLEKLSKLTVLNLKDNPDLNKAQIDQLQRFLPNCRIRSNATD